MVNGENGVNGVTARSRVEEVIGKGHESATNLNLKVAGKNAKETSKKSRSATLTVVDVSSLKNSTFIDQPASLFHHKMNVLCFKGYFSQ